ncbi:MAG: hypothetical protein KME16_09680 [Scytolyngbya sp. HA4215-MV1]|jgi:hypothetical protein|nr:hypothetical protein [Scytolyngbya sp. HA4215-MV1]
MSDADFQTVLQAAFRQCEAADLPLNDQQKQILLRAVAEMLNRWQAIAPLPADTANPLDELTDQERRSLLKFIRQQVQQDQSWKVKFLNDWLQGKDSGSVQFIRDRYGVQWLDSIQPIHLAKYSDLEDTERLTLQIGDRIEISNALWEWVQEDGPCSREWFPCRVVGLPGAETSNPTQINCIVRFDTGAEYEIQGVYDWNRPNWRWVRVSRNERSDS